MKGLVMILGAATLTAGGALIRAQSDVAFPREVYAGRRAALQKQVGDAAIVVPGRDLVGADGLFKQDPTFWYLTGVESPYAVLVMTPSRTALFLPSQYQFAGGQFPTADPRFREAPWNHPIRRLVPGEAAAAATGIAETFPIDDLKTRLGEIIGTARLVYLPRSDTARYAPTGLARPLSEAQQIAREIEAALPGHDFRDVRPMVDRMRLVKDSYEIAALRRAAEISGEGLVAAMRTARPGVNDLEIAGVMEATWKRLGSPRASFAPIVASGPNAMHVFTLMGENYNSVDRVMRDGDLLYIDYGAAEYQTYASDLCRTIPVSGRYTAAQRKYYDVVLEAQEAAIAAVRPGVMMLDVIRAAAGVFRAHGFERFEDIDAMGIDHVWGVMPSPTYYLAQQGGLTRYSAAGFGVRDLGHHIGLEATDSRDYSRPLEAGMVFSVEPKLYVPDEQIAIMTEDMVLVTPAGHDVLSAKTPKRAEEIERIMRR
jgi:Xaa-Pro aminopeptidase